MKVAIQGERGSFSHQAAELMLPGVKVVPCARSAQVFQQLEAGKVEAAVIPIENTLAGSVAEHFDLLLTQNVFIQREYNLRIVHNLIVARGVRLKDVKYALSHPVALDQCRDFFRTHTAIEPVAFYDTAGSVKHVVEHNLGDSAGIASRLAMREYGGKILQAGLEDNKRNFTRFFLIRRKKKILPGANKTSLVFSVKNAAGALFKALSVFALRDISLSKIESRPLRGHPWEYVFYVDFLRGDDEVAHNALQHLEESTEMVKVLGIYPAA
jgi:prephenate dehydratase